MANETPEEAELQPTPGAQLYHEIHNVIRRYREESELGLYEFMGVLEAVKHDISDAMKKATTGE